MKKVLVTISALFLAVFALIFSLVMAVPLAILAYFTGKKLQKNFQHVATEQAGNEAFGDRVIDREYKDLSQ